MLKDDLANVKDVYKKMDAAAFEGHKRRQNISLLKARLATLQKQTEEKRRMDMQVQARNDRLRDFLQRQKSPKGLQQMYNVAVPPRHILSQNNKKISRRVDENEERQKKIVAFTENGNKNLDLVDKMNTQRAEMNDSMMSQVNQLNRRYEKIVENFNQRKSHLETKIAESKRIEQEVETKQNDQRTTHNRQIKELTDEIASKKEILTCLNLKAEDLDKQLNLCDTDIASVKQQTLVVFNESNKNKEVVCNDFSEILIEGKIPMLNILETNSAIDNLEAKKQEIMNVFQEKFSNFVTDTDNAIASAEIQVEKLKTKLSNIEDECKGLEISDTEYNEVKDEYEKIMVQEEVVEEQEGEEVPSSPSTKRLALSQEPMLTVRSPEWDGSLPNSQLETPSSICMIDNSVPPKIKAISQLSFATPTPHTSAIPAPRSPASSVASSTMDFDVYVNRYCKSNPAIRSKLNFMSPPEKQKVPVSKSNEMCYDLTIESTVSGLSGETGKKPNDPPKKFFQTPKERTLAPLPLKPWLPSAKKGVSSGKSKY